MRNSLQLLRLAKAEFPLDPGQSHSLTLAGDRLLLSILTKDVWQSFFIEDQDFDKSPQELWNEIRLMIKPPDEIRSMLKS